jgi:hypothetical protein
MSSKFPQPGQIAQMLFSNCDIPLVETILLWSNPTETFSRSFKVYQETLNERMLVNDESLLRSGLYG